jgi:hypothetical protein
MASFVRFIEIKTIAGPPLRVGVTAIQRLTVAAKA